MRCPKCGKEINQLNLIASNTYICPFCGDSFGGEGDKRDDIGQILKSIVEKYGIGILEDVNRANALLMDLAPRSEKERKLIVTVTREGVVSQLMKLKNEDIAKQEFGINRCIQQLTKDIWITETAANYAVFVIAGALGLQTEMQKRGAETLTVAESGLNGQPPVLKILSKEMGITSEDAIAYALKDCRAIGFKALAANLNIRQLVLPESIETIYPKAFLNCINLQRLTLPKSIKKIGVCAFEGCSSLVEFIIPGESNYKIYNDMLLDKVEKKLIRVTNRSEVEIFKIPNGIQTICKKAFDRSQVKFLEIADTVECIEENAFYMTLSLEKIDVGSKNKSFRSIDGVLHNRRGDILVKYPQGKSGVNYYVEDAVTEIGTQAFSCVRNLESITFTSNVIVIGSKAFEYCPKIENLLLPGSIEIIGDRAFQYCENLRSVMLSRGIQEIGDCAFYGCTSLETVSIPKNVKRIGNLAFANCIKLKSVIIQDNIEFIGDGAFVGCSNIEISVKNNSYVETYCRSHGIICKKI